MITQEITPFISTMLYKRTSFLMLFLILFPCVFWGQVKSGKVVYRVTTDQAAMDKILDQDKYDSKPKLKGYLRCLFRNQIKAVPYIQYQLKFNRERSQFGPQDYMINDNGLNLENAKKNIGVYGTYYTDLTQKQSFHVFNYLENTITVTQPIDALDWKFTDEMKKIQGYTCYKATTKFKPDVGLGGEITAWYTPDLPYPYGPVIYGGLPGMVLEVKQGYYVFTAEKIKVSKKTKK